MSGSSPEIFENKLLQIGVPREQARKFSSRRQFSDHKMEELSRRLTGFSSISSYGNLNIFAAGSFARGEASLHSDVDLFFILDDRVEDAIEHPRLREIEVMYSVISATKEGMKLPPPSNDGEFLKILSLSHVLENLGGRHDDSSNNFTARMLMLLESTPLTNRHVYDQAIESIVDTYLRDYDTHQENFHPTFIVNDILRFWKTLCLNYENRRNQKEDAKKIKQKIRNFKLGYSRLMTCFATVAVLSSYNSLTKEDLSDIFKMPPTDRLLTLANRKPVIVNHLRRAFSQYHWFLERTATSTEELEAYFSDKNNRIEAFTNARKFGDEMFEVVKAVAEESGTLRYLVV